VAARREVDAFDVAVRALRAHDRSAAELADRLERRGVGEATRAEALKRLERLGYLDDGRVARARAEQLAARGSGDAFIAADLERRGIDAELVRDVLEALEPEAERAARIVAERGATPKTARFLASRGFGEDAVAALVAAEE
jgi:regulatory protein